MFNVTNQQNFPEISVKFFFIFIFFFSVMYFLGLLVNDIYILQIKNDTTIILHFFKALFYFIKYTFYVCCVHLSLTLILDFIEFDN